MNYIKEINDDLMHITRMFGFEHVLLDLKFDIHTVIEIAKKVSSKMIDVRSIKQVPEYSGDKFSFTIYFLNENDLQFFTSSLNYKNLIVYEVNIERSPHYTKLDLELLLI